MALFSSVKPGFGLGFSFGLRSQFVLVSAFLLLIPWLGYKYVWEMEVFLREGQEKTLVATTRALATALHERPNLFDQQASFLNKVEKGRDLYAYKLSTPINLDGKLDDWRDYRSLFWQYDRQYLTQDRPSHQSRDLSFSHMVGKYRDYLYAVFDVTDQSVVFRPANSLKVTNNDHVKIALKTADGELKTYIIATHESGWVNAYDQQGLKPIKEIHGYYRKSANGYQVELRMPLALLENKLGFAIVDIDADASEAKTMATSDIQDINELGSVLLPSPEIEKILKGMGHAGSRIWIVDSRQRVLAESGDIQEADGVWSTEAKDDNQPLNWWQQLEQDYLHPLYYKILSRPPEHFLDTLHDVALMEGAHISSALTGKPDSNWRLTPDNKAVILSAAFPIWIDGKVMGAVIAEETTNGIRTLRNKALEKLFSVILAVLVIGVLTLLFFAWVISNRIRRLRDAAEQAIDPQGRVLTELNASNAGDEIGDLSRSFANIVDRLGSYTQYLENMSSRLSHELRTPVSVVRSSLESIDINSLDPEQHKYIERATEGVHRLNTLITTMSEATRLEQSIENAESESFDLRELVSGCLLGYRITYPNIEIKSEITDSACPVNGVPEFIAQLLDKLVTNAVDFSTLNSAIELGLSVKDKKAIVSVTNYGSSLPDELGDTIFDSMVSVRSQQQQQEPHLGLGLYIVRLISDFHHGKVKATNLPEGNGVCFSLELPLKG